MSEAARHLHSVDAETGEIVDEISCPGCLEREATIRGLEHQARSWARKWDNLKRDKERDARAHDLFPLVKSLFDEWRRATGHTRSKFTAARFELALQYVRDPNYGEGFIRRAIAGIGYEPHVSSKPLKNGKHEVYDKFENLFKNAAALERYEQRAPTPRAVDVLAVELGPLERNLAFYATDGAWLV